jgi:hypothetical protein
MELPETEVARDEKHALLLGVCEPHVIFALHFDARELLQASGC